MASDVLKVFVSYNNDIPGKEYRDKFENILKNNNIAYIKSVPDKKYSGLPTVTLMQKIRDEHISDSNVTVVLIGENTWRRKYIDWEIHATIRQTEHSPRGGLLGILLPSYPLFSQNLYDTQTIPPRLYDNIACRYAKIIRWTEDPYTIKYFLNDAYQKKDDEKIKPNHARELFVNNHHSDKWT